MKSHVLVIVLIVLVSGEDIFDDLNDDLYEDDMNKMPVKSDNNYRSVEAVADFSSVVGGMMDSLKQLEKRGDEMVEKINVQEEHLAGVIEEIAGKEAYMETVNKKLAESEKKYKEFFIEMRQNLTKVEEERVKKQEATKSNERKIKAQEVRLKRLLKDITTKVNYVSVIDVKVKQMENKSEEIRNVSLELEDKNEKMMFTLSELENKNKRTLVKVSELREKKENLETQIESYSKILKNRQRKIEDESAEYQNEISSYNKTIARMIKDLTSYQYKIEEANQTLSTYETELMTISPLSLEIKNPTDVKREGDSNIIIPALLVSLVVNLALGGHVFGMFSRLKDKKETNDDYDDVVRIDDYEDTNYGNMDPILHLANLRKEEAEDYINNSEEDPRHRLEDIRKEKERLMGRKNYFQRDQNRDSLRRRTLMSY